MKKIGLLISELNTGGAERVVSRLSTILSDNYEIYLILFENTYISYEYSGTLVNLDVASQIGISKVSLLRKRVQKLKEQKKTLRLDCVISFLDSPNIVNILSKVKSCKTVVSIRNYSELENKNSFLGMVTNYLYKVLYKKADRVVPVTKLIEQSYHLHYGIKSSKLKTIYNPYDVHEIEEQMNTAPSFDVKKLANKTVFVSVGRQMYQKGYWHLLKSFFIVNQKYKDTVLLLIGQIDQKVVKLISELNINKSVFLLGKLDNPFSILKYSDIYVLSSLFEGFPNAMTEAMVCGLPIIASDCKSGPREILAPNTGLNTICGTVEYAEFGILTRSLEEKEDWEKDNITQGERYFAEAMEFLINNKQIREEYAVKAKRRSQDFSYDVCKQEYINLIENI